MTHHSEPAREAVARPVIQPHQTVFLSGVREAVAKNERFYSLSCVTGLLEVIDQFAARLDGRDGASPAPAAGGLEAVRKIAPSEVVAWAVEQWNAQVKNRPLVNVHRRSLDDAWRRVMREFGGDPYGLVGPSHDELHDACVPSPKGDEHLDAALASPAATRGDLNPAAMTERLIDAAIYNEQASGVYVSGARKEMNEARAAIEQALSSPPAPAVESAQVKEGRADG